MKKLVLKFVVIAAMANVPLFAYIEYGMPYYFNTDYPLYTYMRDYVMNKPSPLLKKDGFSVTDPKYLYMGDSTVVYGVNPKYISAESQNISLSGAGIVELYYLLKRHYESHRPPEKIFLSVSQTAFEWEDAFAPRTMKVHMLDVSELMEIINRSIELNSAPYDYSLSIKKYEGVLDVAVPVDVEASPFEQYAQLILYRLNFIYYYYATIANGRYFRNYDENVRYYNMLDNNQGFRIHSTRISDPSIVNKAAFTDRQHFRPALLHVDYFEKFLRLAAEHGTQIIFEAVPVNKASYEKLHGKKHFIGEYNKLLSDMQEKFPEHILSSEMPIFPDEYYSDGTHFNENGATYYSKYLKDKYFQGQGRL